MPPTHLNDPVTCNYSMNLPLDAHKQYHNDGESALEVETELIDKLVQNCKCKITRHESAENSK